jgi:hypothetical protein
MKTEEKRLRRKVGSRKKRKTNGEQRIANNKLLTK